MTMFPMDVIKLSARAQSVSGGKEYHLVLVNAGGNKSLLIQRFGKTGKWGQLQISTGTRRDILRAFDEKFREKWNGQYRDHYLDKRTTANDEQELKAQLGPQYWAQLAPSDLKFLIPEADTSQVRGQITPVWGENEDGKWQKKEPQPKIFKDPEPTIEDRVAQNNTWGMF